MYRRGRDLNVTLGRHFFEPNAAAVNGLERGEDPRCQAQPQIHPKSNNRNYLLCFLVPLFLSKG